MNILIFFVVLLVLVLVHEFGHFFAAKRFGIRVDEFGFGFPPKLFGKKFGETEYTFNLLPLGGFVKIFGENPDDENTNGVDSARSMVNKAKWKQAIVLLAGVFSNFLLAWLLFSFSFMSGLPSSVSNIPEKYEVKDPYLLIVSVLPDSPAEKAGLKEGDKITSIELQNSETEDDILVDINPLSLKEFVTSHAEKEIKIGYSNSGEDVVNYTSVIPTTELTGGDPSIGIAMDQVGTVKLSFFRAFWEGAKLNLVVTTSTLSGLFNLIADGIRGEGSLSSITGPVGLVSIAGEAYKFGLSYLLSFTALISINLAIINLVPFPALDGGRILFLIIEKIKGSRLSPQVANIANMLGFAILIILMLFVTYNDIVRLF